RNRRSPPRPASPPPPSPPTPELPSTHRTREPWARNNGAMTIQTPLAATADIGIIGIGVMGTSLARNLARHGHAVAAYDLHPENTARLVTRHGQEGTFVPAESLADFVSALRVPRVAIILVPA